ncbi:hypothetical protein ACFQZX_10940 [Mucilaginibacter litoreus]|uniref:Uncharacterized protein n=2 Tax=Mucilaginibacter litoreus TaxID=1048221 RepID=A0ABW3ATF9_9SPHI
MIYSYGIYFEDKYLLLAYQMKDNKYIIRRTLSQERFEVLWTKRKNGEATLKDLTEMDEIINRDAGVRQFVLEEMAAEQNSLDDDNGLSQIAPQLKVPATNIFKRIKAIFGRLFILSPQAKIISFPNVY